VKPLIYRDYLLNNNAQNRPQQAAVLINLHMSASLSTFTMVNLSTSAKGRLEIDLVSGAIVGISLNLDVCPIMLALLDIVDKTV
jgi:hypothetical protein